MRRDEELSLRSGSADVTYRGIVVSREGSRREAYFVEVCLTNEPRDADNLVAPRACVCVCTCVRARALWPERHAGRIQPEFVSYVCPD